ncbi:MAG: MerR family transcriptional regulator [Clostridia bacterium]|nr:MerR family transcriptional regulator [Clostridia bacterium]
MLIKIGTLARHFGISPQTIRYYEEKGFLRPRRSGGGGDRRYHVRTLKLLSSVRSYHNMGFGTKEIQALFGETELDGIDGHLRAQTERVEREMARLRFRKEALDRQRENVGRVRRMLNVCELSALPPMYLLIDRRDGQIIEDEAIWRPLEKWIDALPFVEGAVRVAADSVRTGDLWNGRESGYCVWAGDAERFGLPVDAPVERVEYPLCVHTVVIRSGDIPSYAAIADYARENGLRLCGPAIHRALAKVGEFRASGEDVIPGAVYYECWAPVTREC